MASNDKSEGPKIGQLVLYNNSGTIIPAIINVVNATGTVGLITFPGGTTPANQNTVSYDNLGGSGKWYYMDFF